MAQYDYRLGLDIGITSVGWAVLETDSYGEPKRIADMGVRIFTAAEIPKTGDSLAAPRRKARCLRRRLRRRRLRIERVKGLLVRSGIVTKEDIIKIYDTKCLDNVYGLRCEALDRVLTGKEFAQVLIHIAKHRGFRSTRKAETEAKENGAVLTAVKENKRIMYEKNYRTVGEMIFKDDSFRTYTPWTEDKYTFSPRNKAGDYKHTILREMLVEEVHTIFERQRAMGNGAATEAFEKEYTDIMTSQRSFDKGPGSPSPYGGDMIDKMVGYCTLEKDEKRAAKASFTSERFVLLQKVNNITLIGKGGDRRRLTDDERMKLVKICYTVKTVTFSTVRKKLGISDNEIFANVLYGRKTREEVEKTRFVKMDNTFNIMGAIEKNDSEYDFSDKTVLDDKAIFMLDEIGRILTIYKADDNRRSELEKFCLSDDAVEELLKLNPSKFQNLSLKAMYKIMPFLEQGFTYDKACEAAGYDFKADYNGGKIHLLKGEEINDQINEIPNPVVKRSISQTIKVIYAVIMKYGSPMAVNIELAREMSKNFSERKDIDKKMQENMDKNEKLVLDLHGLGVSSPTGQDIIKYKLWKEQDGRCMYSGDSIPFERLFQSGEADIDHIVPYSMSFNNGYSNKVLVSAKCNREKGNRLPFEYFTETGRNWNEFSVRVNATVKDSRKRSFLLKEHFTEDDRQAFKERNLTDTKYITTFIYNIIRNYLEMAPILDKKKQVYAVNGSITHYMRQRWGIGDKDRSTDKHHSVDAVIIACCTDGMIQKITRYSQGQELKYGYGRTYKDEITGEIIKRDNYSDEEWIKKFGKLMPYPWNQFKHELELRISPTPRLFIDNNREAYNKIIEYCENPWGKPYTEPIFVSRMPNHKVSGAGHLETVRSPRDYERGGMVISKIDIKDLKLDKDGEIADYYDPMIDTLLYDALRDRLAQFGGDGKKAFAEEFHKPKSDGSAGPVVRKVKIEQKQSSGVLLNDGKGIASNGSMIRIDIFRENGKYYFVPVYTADAVKKRLPNKAASHRNYSDWKEMNDNDFKFSLYPGDVFKFAKKGGMNAITNEKTPIIVNDTICYYTGADISTASIAGQADDSSYTFRGMGIQGLESLEKYQVGILGDYHKVDHEIRMTFD